MENTCLASMYKALVSIPSTAKKFLQYLFYYDKKIN